MTDTLVSDMLVQRERALDPFTDDELSSLALAADPDTDVDDDAVSLWDHLAGSPSQGPLPEWYMPAPMRRVPCGVGGADWCAGPST